MPGFRFALIYAPVVLTHVEAIGSRWRGVVRRTIEERLTVQPLVITANRKPLRQPAAFADAWELRCGPENRFRVFYRVDVEARQVRILAIGEKRGNVLKIAGERFEL